MESKLRISILDANLRTILAGMGKKKTTFCEMALHHFLNSNAGQETQQLLSGQPYNSDAFIAANKTSIKAQKDSSSTNGSHEEPELCKKKVSIIDLLT